MHADKRLEILDRELLVGDELAHARANLGGGRRGGGERDVVAYVYSNFCSNFWLLVIFGNL